ncbi:hypothetical protein MC7420_8047 [Coleofasciculus chthonoplastes PCC 7420]|uniref:Uncharacterized protein n=1 Tax=Coleofasciculus chthonoplastes PCC 7420 TaxID=118168 RepID=B4VIL4_9CYAN|nr:hypothetical protein MC7420_8047 [Coleofasciculus chthonoplastes PCC 7420]
MRLSFLYYSNPFWLRLGQGIKNWSTYRGGFHSTLFFTLMSLNSP